MCTKKKINIIYNNINFKNLENIIYICKFKKYFISKNIFRGDQISIETD